MTATAQAADLPQTRPAAQSPLTADDLYQACTQNQAETLPNPFTDVSPDHWAYKSVLTMHYCGAFRQAAPRRLFERSLASPQQSVMPPQPR
ncbi:hypothetical protein GS601_03400 [Myxacorys almedinensis A]|uniref:Uncharacterized protein n=1 Tax=Myxacorys almedinensis A TaxID=2690445 RepID=A0A8J7YYC0_9CYAN|nr:hypothetical protein [Myxacorys almedinensis A]